MNNTGGPAFPTTKPLEHWGDPNQGMTLRDYFAAKAMQGILFEGLDEIETAKNAYAMADAMLHAREVK
jgi:hypothetical protein